MCQKMPLFLPPNPRNSSTTNQQVRVSGSPPPTISAGDIPLRLSSRILSASCRFARRLPFSVHHQSAMKPFRIHKAKRAVEQDLPSGGLEQIGAAHHLGDSHRGVVGHAGKLVARHSAAGLPSRRHTTKSPKSSPATKRCGPRFRSLNSIASPSGTRKRQFAPTAWSSLLTANRISDILSIAATAGARIHRFIVQRIRLYICIFVGSAQRGSQVLARAATRIKEAAVDQLAPYGHVGFVPLALHVRLERPTDVRALLPGQAQPAQIFQRGIGVLGSAAFAVQVFHAQNEFAACSLRSLTTLSRMCAHGRRAGSRWAKAQAGPDNGVPALESCWPRSNQCSQSRRFESAKSLSTINPNRRRPDRTCRCRCHDGVRICRGSHSSDWDRQRLAQRPSHDRPDPAQTTPSSTPRDA